MIKQITMRHENLEKNWYAKNLLILQFSQHILQFLHKHSHLNLKGPLEVGIAKKLKFDRKIETLKVLKNFGFFQG